MWAAFYLGESMTELNQWPQCPQCDALRSTHCPICRTAGIDFLPVDPEYAPAPDDAAGIAPLSSGCYAEECSAGCHSEMPAEKGGGQAGSTEAATGGMVICPTCDEPFVPAHPNRCEWCGHRFPDGYTVDVVEPEHEQLNGRTIAAMLGLGSLLLALAIYFAMIF